MNPKGVNDLDPKLKETYERVMGTSFPTPQPVPQTAQINSTPQPQVDNQPVNSNPQPVLQPVPAQVDPIQATQVFRAGNPFVQPDPPPADLIAKANMNTGVFAPQAQKKKHNLIPVVLLFGGIIFFTAYAAIWAKVFGLY